MRRVRYITRMQTMAQIQERLGVPMEAIREFCQRWNIVELALFGSIVRDDFGPESDVDVMVRFGPEGMAPLPWGTIGVKMGLEDLLGRSVDVVVKGNIKNPYRLRSISRDYTVMYAA